MYQAYTQDEEKIIQDMLKRGFAAREIAQRLGRKFSGVESKIKHMKRNVDFTPLTESPMPKYKDPLKTSGDAVILSDVEAPFQHSEFINRVLDLAYSWKVETLHLAGDILHNDRLSAWGAEWIPEASGEAFAKLENFIMRLPEKLRQQGLDMIEGMGKEQPDEIMHARKILNNFNHFKEIVCVIGNHDDRILRAMDIAINPRELLVQIDKHKNDNWKIAAYYYSFVETEKGLFRIEHPRNSGRTAAQDLAVQYHCHIIMGHSHRWAINRDPSGKYWAIQTGHCVDEERLTYVMQRSSKRDAHVLGATIIRGGYPFVLCPESPFETMKKW